MRFSGLIQMIISEIIYLENLKLNYDEQLRQKPIIKSFFDWLKQQIKAIKTVTQIAVRLG